MIRVELCLERMLRASRTKLPYIYPCRYFSILLYNYMNVDTIIIILAMLSYPNKHRTNSRWQQILHVAYNRLDCFFVVSFFEKLILPFLFVFPVKTFRTRCRRYHSAYISCPKGHDTL